MLTVEMLLHLACDAEQHGDLERMKQCYERGAELGDADCLQALGYLYDVGEGAPVDKIQAMKLYQRAWRRGSQAAANNIAVLYHEQGNFKSMFRWFWRLASMNDSTGHLQVAKCYLGGIGVRKDVQVALRHLSFAAQSEWLSEHELDEAQTLLEQHQLKLVN